MNVPLIDFVQPLDVLLFKPDSVAGWIIAVKTWCQDACHTEIVSFKNGSIVETFTARGGNSKGSDGKGGVNFYRDLPERAQRVSLVLRPRDLSRARPQSARQWAQFMAVGQAYDYSGLLVFALAAKQGNPTKMFCSEACTRYSRQAGLEPFHPAADADLIAPATFRFSPIYDQYRVKEAVVQFPALGSFPLEVA